MKDLVWNVYRYDYNGRKIVVYNIFEHGSFYEEIKKLLKKKHKLTRDEFEKELKSNTMYYFWSKAEHEVVITTFPPHITKKELDRLRLEDVKYCCNINPEIGEKIDIYDQLRLNWDLFVEYVWNYTK